MLDLLLHQTITFKHIGALEHRSDCHGRKDLGSAKTVGQTTIGETHEEVVKLDRTTTPIGVFWSAWYTKKK